MQTEALDGSVFSADTGELLCLLAAHRVRYVIIGGEAVIYYGHIRLTGDTDIFYDARSMNAARLFAALQVFWHGTVPGIHTAEELSEPGLILQFGRPPHRIDLLNAISGVSFDEAWRTRCNVSYSTGRRAFLIHYVGLTCLMRNKRAVGRPKDMEDLAFLTASAKRKRKTSR